MFEPRAETYLEAYELLAKMADEARCTGDPGFIATDWDAARAERDALVTKLSVYGTKQATTLFESAFDSSRGPSPTIRSSDHYLISAQSRLRPLARRRQEERLERGMARSEWKCDLRAVRRGRQA